MMEEFRELKGFENLTVEEVGFEKDFIDILKMVAPGTSLRNGLDDLLNARMGALIVFDNGNIDDLFEGGFRLNSKFSSQKLVELAKMDGAIILSKDVKNILSANTLLIPDSGIYTRETGTRHKAAERTAKQAKTLTIAVSERKNRISVYYKDQSYILQSGSEILRRATETLQILEKQKEVFNELLDELNLSELKRNVSVKDVSSVLQRVEIMKRVSEIIERYLVELGKEGIIVKMRLKELISKVYDEEDIILRDYFSSVSDAKEILEKMDFDFLLDPLNIPRMLFEELHDKNISPKGWRILYKTNLLPRYVDSLIGNFKTLDNIMTARDRELVEILDNEAMVAFFREELYSLRERLSIGKRI
ncbi:MAG: DNA integrity scanning diadenylate cyclase DisA [Bacilli bacterium]|nr:DNA integrity scanning diadenylate cyclase DisA [Bacilli bacterium]